jgi:2-polyprenyl-3-methyl-5-hydroxy-6-metoxy-1,4-benzoquinol methylase
VIHRPSFTDLVERISERRPLHAKFVKDAFALLDREESGDADSYLAHLLSQHSLDFIAESYETILDDTFDAQLFFMSEGRYRHSTFEEVANSVYFEPSYMKRYMVGLAITNFLWPNHLAIRRFFRKTFPWDRGGTYLEVGPGHGLFLLQALRNPYLERYVGVDISPASLALTAEVVRHLMPKAMHRLQLIEADFLAETELNGSYDLLVLGEVLEHVERPRSFLERLKSLAAADAHIFVTTCINAPAIDHITVFSTQADVEDLIRDSGLAILERLSVPYVGRSLSECVAQRLPINVAYVLSP